jgi:hypothetical protein
MKRKRQAKPQTVNATTSEMSKGGRTMKRIAKRQAKPQTVNATTSEISNREEGEFLFGCVELYLHILRSLPIKDVLLSAARVCKGFRALANDASLFADLCQSAGICTIKICPAAKDWYSTPERKWALIVQPCLRTIDAVAKIRAALRNVDEPFHYKPTNQDEYCPWCPDEQYEVEEDDGKGPVVWKPDPRMLSDRIQLLHDDYGLQVPPAWQQLGHLTSFVGHVGAFNLPLYPYGIFAPPPAAERFQRKFSLQTILGPKVGTHLLNTRGLFIVGKLDWAGHGEGGETVFCVDLKTPPTTEHHRQQGARILVFETSNAYWDNFVQEISLEQLLAHWASRSDKREEQDDDDNNNNRRTAIRSFSDEDQDDLWIRDLEDSENETSQCLNDWLEPTEDEKALIEAAEKGDLDAVTMLVKERGVHPDCQEPKEGITPLMAAVRGNNTAVAEFLLQHGAQAEREDLHGRFAIAHLRVHNLELEQLFLHHAQGKCFGNRMAEVLKDQRKYLVSCGLLSSFF